MSVDGRKQQPNRKRKRNVHAKRRPPAICASQGWTLFLKYKIGGHKSFLWGQWYPCFGLLVRSPLSGQPYSCLGEAYVLHWTLDQSVQGWPVSRRNTSDWSVNSFLMTVYENIFSVVLWTGNSDLTSHILLNNHYKTIYEPVRNDCSLTAGCKEQMTSVKETLVSLFTNNVYTKNISWLASQLLPFRLISKLSRSN